MRQRHREEFFLGGGQEEVSRAFFLGGDAQSRSIARWRGSDGGGEGTSGGGDKCRPRDKHRRRGGGEGGVCVQNGKFSGTAATVKYR